MKWTNLKDTNVDKIDFSLSILEDIKYVEDRDILVLNLKNVDFQYFDNLKTDSEPILKDCTFVFYNISFLSVSKEGKVEESNLKDRQQLHQMFLLGGHSQKGVYFDMKIYAELCFYIVNHTHDKFDELIKPSVLINRVKDKAPKGAVIEFRNISSAFARRNDDAINKAIVVNTQYGTVKIKSKSAQGKGGRKTVRRQVAPSRLDVKKIFDFKLED